ncbi:MAG: nucleoside hydrolase [Ilumatobacteraceae bacterium]|nr:nucleoside hydrolase [Ilumatobacteraceae bacterium]
MRRGLIALATALLVATACSEAGTDERAATTPTATTPTEPAAVPVVLDYSTTPSDVGALLYLATHPDVDLRAVTLPGTGEADCEPGTRTTRAILAAIGRDDVPVGCTDEGPIEGDRDWPLEWRERANRFPGVTLPTVPAAAPLDAHALLADTLDESDESVTIVAVGPLTNVAQVLAARPELEAAIDRVVVMGGAVDTAGNVEGAPTAEWNLHVDPEAARRVLASGIDVTLVPLDATDLVPWTPALAAQVAALTTPAGALVAEMVSSLESLDGLFLWDELTAVVAVRPDLATAEDRTLVVDDDGATIDDPGGASVRVVTSVDADAATVAWLTVLNGGTAPAFDPLDDDERQYLDTVAGLWARTATAGAAEPVTAGDVLGPLFDRADRLVADLAELSPPPAFATLHRQLAAAVAAFAGKRAAAETALADITVDDPYGAANEAAIAIGADAALGEVETACDALSTASLQRGGPELCGGA